MLVKHLKKGKQELGVLFKRQYLIDKIDHKVIGVVNKLKKNPMVKKLHKQFQKVVRTMKKIKCSFIIASDGGATYGRVVGRTLKR